MQKLKLEIKSGQKPKKDRLQISFAEKNIPQFLVGLLVFADLFHAPALVLGDVGPGPKLSARHGGGAEIASGR